MSEGQIRTEALRLIGDWVVKDGPAVVATQLRKAAAALDGLDLAEQCRALAERVVELERRGGGNRVGRAALPAHASERGQV